jgi:hypothetical protein
MPDFFHCNIGLQHRESEGKQRKVGDTSEHSTRHQLSPENGLPILSQLKTDLEIVLFHLRTGGIQCRQRLR